MCKWGNTKTIHVTISPNLSHTGKVFKKAAKIDSCIAPIVEALEKQGIHMLSSCCGHGKTNGQIDLADGRKLVILNK